MIPVRLSLALAQDKATRCSPFTSYYVIIVFDVPMQNKINQNSVQLN